MAVTWTEEQEQVISLRNRNMLVSAAAGSGKTAVLVERILTMITDEEHPVDIDSLLIVTFTRAAASEMKERILAAIEKKLNEHPEDEHLQRQTTLINNAQINTIDGYCSYIVRNYFHTIGLDPAFRIADEGELELLKADVIEKVLEEAYEEGTPEFIDFVEAYSAGKNDKALEDMIFSLYNFSTSAPWPKEWIENCKKAYEAESLDSEGSRAWMSILWSEARNAIVEIQQQLSLAVKKSQGADGPYMYLPMINGLLDIAEELEASTSYEKWHESLAQIKYPRLSSKKDEKVDADLREEVKGIFTQAKDMIKELHQNYFQLSEAEVLKGIAACRPSVEILIHLTERFMEEYTAAKRKKNICDFSDVEHFALDILVTKNFEDGSIHVNPTARDFAARFEEIMIDEYQDSNMVQELLLTFSSKMIEGKHNIFMVGDVKQSIYRFRLARPELFMEKLASYSLEEGKEQRIDLHKNFRSRREVISFVNLIFSQIMGPSLGSVVYDDKAALNYGASYPEAKDSFADTEVLCIPVDEGGMLEEKSQRIYREMEARAVGQRIREIVGKEQIFDNKLQVYRPARYSDCVVLLRTLTGWADTFAEVLNAMNIPAFATSKTGYFSALEVVTVLNYLHICDNPLQDIPFTAVLLSPIGKMTDEQIARIRSIYQEESMYQACRNYLQSRTHENSENQSAENQESANYENAEETYMKIQNFFKIYDHICSKITYTPIHELIQIIFDETGYGNYASALPGGKQRSANLQMLVEKAMEYEKTSYRGLFNFIRYIEHLQKYQVDFGEVNMLGENEDTVRIMSIHKSKGLEFPVVFVSGMGKKIGNQDSRGNLICHGDYGIGLSFIDSVRRTKAPTLIKSVLAQQIKMENLGEELRILYVAFTRAKEKLILTGTITKLEKNQQYYAMAANRKEELLPHSMRAHATMYWDWVLPCLLEENKIKNVSVKYLSIAALTEQEVVYQAQREVRKEQFLSWNITETYDKEFKDRIKQQFTYEYPYKNLEDIPAKMSVSELKKQSIEDEEGLHVYEEETVIPLIPEFLKEEKGEVWGAQRGTAYHRVMECIDYTRINSKEELSSDLADLVKQGKIDTKMLECVNIDDIWKFVDSSIGHRMKIAMEQDNLYREQPFVIGVAASQIEKGWDEKETVLVQGIIDAFFYEGEQLVIVDYKTDKVYDRSGQELIDKYHVQLEYYGQALQKLTHKQIKEQIIYSFALGKELSF